MNIFNDVKQKATRKLIYIALVFISCLMANALRAEGNIFSESFDASQECLRSRWICYKGAPATIDLDSTPLPGGHFSGQSFHADSGAAWENAHAYVRINNRPQEKIYLRTYVYISNESLPNGGASGIFFLGNYDLSQIAAAIFLVKDASGATHFQLRIPDQISRAYAPVSAQLEYEIELYIDNLDDRWEWRINGATIASGYADPGTSIQTLLLGAGYRSSGGRVGVYFDNVDIDSNGWVNAAPDGVIVSPSGSISIMEGESVVFAGTATDPDGHYPLSYLWQFGADSGIPAMSVEDPGSIRFDIPGVYPVTFTVTDHRGLADPSPASVTVTVQSQTNLAPEGVIDSPAGNITISAGESVNFAGTGTDPDGDLPLTYLWQFGAGSGISAMQVEDPGLLRFDTPGTYTVTFTVTDRRGLSDYTPATRTITVVGNQSQQFLPDWSGVSTGPFHLVDPPNIQNPVLTAADVTDAYASFVADPFLFFEGNTWYMFFEVYGGGEGAISVATSSDGLSWRYEGMVLDEPFHLSYPLVFKYGENHYMVPETYQIGEVRIYTATDFPFTWQYTDTLVSGRPFVDPAIFRHQETWWMFVGDTGGSNLYLYYADDLLGPWVEHPASPIIQGDSARARPGGRSFVYDGGKVIRIAQEGGSVYGRRVRAFEVDVLTKTEYREHEIPESPLLTESGQGWNATGMHQLDPWWTGNHWIAAVDGQQNGIWSIGIYVSEPTSAPNGVIDAPAGAVMIAAGESVVFGGTGSDPDGDLPLSYLWQFGAGSGVAAQSVEDPGAVRFDVPGAYTVTFTVTDARGLADPTPASVTVTVQSTAPTNTAPNGVIDAPAGAVTIAAGESVVFGGTGSDPDGDLPLSYLWQFGAGSGIAAQSVEDPGAVRFDVPGAYTVTFTVTDARGLADPTPASVVVTVQSTAPTNTAPNGAIDAPAGAVTIAAGESVVFGGTGSDPDGDLPLSYLWQFGTGSGVAAQSVEDPGTVRFDVPGVYTVTFTVTDARGLADPTPASVTVTVQNGGGSSPLFSESFEGSQECAGARWHCYHGAPSTIDPDSTAPAGSLFTGQSLRANAGAMWENAHAYARLASPQETLYFHTQLYLNGESLPNGSSSGLLFLGNTDLSGLAGTVYLRKNGAGERYLELAVPEGSPRATYPVALQTAYALELYLDNAANRWEWRMNGATVASGNADPGAGVQTLLLSAGYRASGGSVDVYFDNVTASSEGWLE